MKHNNGISVRAGWRTEQGRMEARGRRGERVHWCHLAGGSRGYTGVKGWTAEGWRLRKGEEAECWCSLRSESMSPVYTLGNPAPFPEERRLHNVLSRRETLNYNKGKYKNVFWNQSVPTVNPEFWNLSNISDSSLIKPRWIFCSWSKHQILEREKLL